MKQWDYGKRSGDGVLFYMDGEFCLKTRTSDGRAIQFHV